MSGATPEATSGHPPEEPDAGKPHVRIREGGRRATGASTRPTPAFASSSPAISSASCGPGVGSGAGSVGGVGAGGAGSFDAAGLPPPPQAPRNVAATTATMVHRRPAVLPYRHGRPASHRHRQPRRGRNPRHCRDRRPDREPRAGHAPRDRRPPGRPSRDLRTHGEARRFARRLARSRLRAPRRVAPAHGSVARPRPSGLRASAPSLRCASSGRPRTASGSAPTPATVPRSPCLRGAREGPRGSPGWG